MSGLRELAVADDAGDQGADAGQLLQEEHEGLQRRGRRVASVESADSEDQIKSSGGGSRRAWPGAVRTMMQLSHCVVWMLNSSCSRNRVEATELPKQQNT